MSRLFLGTGLLFSLALVAGFLLSGLVLLFWGLLGLVYFASFCGLWLGLRGFLLGCLFFSVFRLFGCRFGWCGGNLLGRFVGLLFRFRRLRFAIVFFNSFLVLFRSWSFESEADAEEDNENH